MKIIIIGMMVVMTAAVMLMACEKKPVKTEVPAVAAAQKVVYTCPMHPQIISDKPGKCPICGMDLVEK